MASTPPSGFRSALRTFGAGAVCGFLAGAFVVATIVWRYGNVIGSYEARLHHPADPPSAVERWIGGAVDDGGEGVIRSAPESAVATSGTSSAVVEPAPASTPVLDAPAGDLLRDRDLLLPVEGVSADQLTRTFEDRRGSRLHEAIDILAPRGTPVRAVEDGTIARLFTSKAGGLTIYQFDPTEQFSYYYAHLDRYAEGLTEHQAVKRGQTIGYVGVSGNAPKDTPHLHFAIFRLTAAKRWWEGTPIDPYDALR